MNLPLLVATVFTIAMQYKCLIYAAMDDVGEGSTASLSPEYNFLERFNQPESRLIPIFTINPFNKHQNQNGLTVNAATQQQLDQLRNALQTLQTAYNKVKPQYQNITRLFRNLQALNAKLRAQGIMISNLVNNAGKIKQSYPRCPSSAPTGSKVLGTFCYWIGTAKLDFGAASTSCRAGGGTLAEPLPAFGPPLFTVLQTAFNTTVTASSILWIGADNFDDNVPPNFGNRVLYLTTNQQVPGEENALAGLTNTDTTQYGAILTTTSSFNYMVATTPNNYVCQSFTV